eukprot:6205297-Ditylum_brightwellii.AAC.1
MSYMQDNFPISYISDDGNNDNDILMRKKTCGLMTKSDKVKYYRRFANQRDVEDEKEAIDIAKIRHEEILMGR